VPTTTGPWLVCHLDAGQDIGNDASGDFPGYAWCRRGRISWSEIRASVPLFIVALAAGGVSVSPHGGPAERMEVFATGGWVARLASLDGRAVSFGKVIFPVG